MIKHFLEIECSPSEVRSLLLPWCFLRAKKVDQILQGQNMRIANTSHSRTNRQTWWFGAPSYAKTKFRFIKPGCKMNVSYYIHQTPEFFLTALAETLPGGSFCFHRDPAPFHGTKSTLKFPRSNNEAITSNEWILTSFSRRFFLVRIFEILTITPQNW